MVLGGEVKTDFSMTHLSFCAAFLRKGTTILDYTWDFGYTGIESSLGIHVVGVVEPGFYISIVYSYLEGAKNTGDGPFTVGAVRIEKRVQR